MSQFKVPNHVLDLMHSTAVLEHQRVGEILGPFYLVKAKMLRENAMWRAVYAPEGVDPRDYGQCVQGFGKTPAEAVRAFNKAWLDGDHPC